MYIMARNNVCTWKYYDANIMICTFLIRILWYYAVQRFTLADAQQFI